MVHLGAQSLATGFSASSGPTLLARRGVAGEKLALRLSPLKGTEPDPTVEPAEPEVQPGLRTEVALPDFSGVWVMHAVVGPAGLLEDTGLGWMTRQDYGKGRFTMSVEQAGEQFTVAEGMDGDHGSALKFHAGDSEQVASDPERLRRTFVRADWHGQALRIEERTAGRDPFPAKFFRLDGERLVLEFTTADGDVVAVRYVRFARARGFSSSIGSRHHPVN